MDRSKNLTFVSSEAPNKSNFVKEYEAGTPVSMISSIIYYLETKSNTARTTKLNLLKVHRLRKRGGKKKN